MSLSRNFGRTRQARLQLNPLIVRALEHHVVHANPCMTAIRKLTTPTTSRCPDRVLQFDWGEGVQEVAAILDSAGSARTSPRSVFFRFHNSEQYDYILPLRATFLPPVVPPRWQRLGYRLEHARARQDHANVAVSSANAPATTRAFAWGHSLHRHLSPRSFHHMAART